ncbi:MAG: hypothetical protein KBD24_01680 [Candidatus Pacebacteria bacterium]|nr:hypothetical protein [Candidatus Paceibacterota bacterium]
MPHTLFRSILFFTTSLFLVMLFSVYGTTIAHAQKSGILNNMASIELRPPYPTPGTEVTAILHAGSTNKATTRVAWYMGDKVVQEEYSNFEYHFTAGPLGSTINLSVTAYPEKGNSLTVGVKRVVGAVTIIWEGKTYTPPFYAGRALHSQGSDVVLQAIPMISDGAGGTIDPSKLVFSWRIGGETNPSKAGIGLDTITTKAFSPLASLSVSVLVSDKLENVLAEKHIYVPVTQPAILFYEADPLMGIRYGTAFGARSRLSSAESRVYAEPYYMSAPSRSDSSLVYAWRVGSQKLSEQGSIVLRPNGVGSGSARIELVVTNNKVWQQNARNEMTMLFDTATLGSSNTETTPL